jgi:hypothetical protein
MQSREAVAVIEFQKPFFEITVFALADFTGEK